MAHALRSPRLLPGERKAIATELLLQQYQFRQNLALQHGLPMPAGPVSVVEPAPEIAPEKSPIDRAAAAVQDEDVKQPGTEPKSPWWKTKLAKAALGAALLGSGVSIPYAASWLFSEAVAPIDIPDEAPSSVLTELDRRGYSVAPTDLGDNIKKAFSLNPALREKLLEDVRRTLETRDDGSGDTGAGS